MDNSINQSSKQNDKQISNIIKNVMYFMIIAFILYVLKNMFFEQKYYVQKSIYKPKSNKFSKFKL
jgi:hypothetical protein